MIVFPAVTAATARRLLDDEAPSAHGSLTLCPLAAADALPLRPTAGETAALVVSGAVDWRDEPASPGTSGQDRDPVAVRLEPGDGLFAPPGSRSLLTAPTGAALLLILRADAAPTDPRAVGDLRATLLPASGWRFADVPTAGATRDDIAGSSGMRVRWLVSAESVGSTRLVVATSTFAAGGDHTLHRHPNADEFFLVVRGAGEHLTADGPVRVSAGDLVHIPAGEWHGYRSQASVETTALYGYLGAGSLARAGYEVMA